MNSKECKWCCSVDFTLRNTEKVNLSCSKTAFSNMCATSLSLQHFNWRLRRMWATPQKMTRCGWANCCLHKIKLRFVEMDYCYLSMRSVMRSYLLKCFFSSHSGDISVVFVRKQLQMKLLAWLLLARLAGLVLLRQLFKKMVPSVLCESRPFNFSLSHSKSSWSHLNRTPFPQPG